MRNFCVTFLFLAVSLFAADSLSMDGVNFPLPHQSAYTGKGISVGLAGGIFDPTEDCDCLGVWQGQGEYFYKSWLSGGIDVRFFGGNLDSDVMVLYQRYRVNLKLFMLGDFFSLYLSPVLGLENTSLSEFRNELRGLVSGNDEDIIEVNGTCERMFSLGGFTMGMDMGVGFSLGKYFGLTGSLVYEYSFSVAQQITLTPGLAFDLRRVWGFARRKLRSSWVSAEVSFQRFFNRRVDSWAKSFVLGVQLGL